MKIKPILLILFVINLIFISGCTYGGGGNASIAQTEADIQDSTQKIPQEQLDILATATHADVDTISKNWDADAENDGIIIYPELKNNNDEIVNFEDVSLVVDIEIWTTKYDDNFNEVKDRQIYKGTGTITSWKDGNPFFQFGIKVPFEDVKTIASDREYGLVLVKIHTIDGKVYEAKNNYIRIRPE